MYNVNLDSNNYTFNSSFHKPFYSPTKNQITQYQKNFISHYQDQNRMYNNSFYSNAQSPYIFPIPKNRINNFLQRTPSPPSYNRLIFQYKNNFSKFVNNQSPPNIKRSSGNMINQFSPMHLLPRPVSPDLLNATTNNNKVNPLFQNPITSININNMHRYAKTPEPRRNDLNNSLSMSNYNPNNISGSQSNMNNINNVSPVNNITHIAQYSNNLPINSRNQKKISQHLFRNSKDLVNNNNIIYQMHNMNNLNDNSQNNNFQNISTDKDSSISKNINSNIHNIHVINPRNSNENQGNYNSSGKSNPAIIYNPNQNATPNNINNNQNNYSSSGKNNPAINYNLNHQNQNYYNSPGKNIPVAKFYPNRNFSPHNLIQNLKNDNSNSSGKSNLAVYIPSQNIDPNIGNYNSPANNINNIHLIHPPHIVVQNHINIIPIKKPIFSDRRNILIMIIIYR